MAIAKFLTILLHQIVSFCWFRKALNQTASQTERIKVNQHLIQTKLWSVCLMPVLYWPW